MFNRLWHSMCRILLLLSLILLICVKSHADPDYVTQITKPIPTKIEMPKVNIHKGSKILDIQDVSQTIDHVFSNVSNLKEKHSLKNLVLETMMVETHLGGAPYQSAEKRYRNYGIAQFREESAKYVLQLLKKRDKLAYDDLMKYYFKNKSLRYNISYNVPFSIGLCAEYYLTRDKNVNKKISTLSKRAQIWKKEYNTYKGLGTVNAYVSRVKQFKGKTYN